jgi:hypothetical protein
MQTYQTDKFLYGLYIPAKDSHHDWNIILTEMELKKSKKLFIFTAKL